MPIINRFRNLDGSLAVATPVNRFKGITEEPTAVSIPKYVNPATLDKSTQPKISAPKEDTSLYGKINTFASDVLNKIPSFQDFSDPTGLRRKEALSKDSISQETKESAISPSLQLRLQEKQGKVLTPDEKIVADIGEKASSQMAFDAVLGFMNPAAKLFSGPTKLLSRPAMEVMDALIPRMKEIVSKKIGTKSEIKAAQEWLDYFANVKKTGWVHPEVENGLINEIIKAQAPAQSAVAPKLIPSTAENVVPSKTANIVESKIPASVQKTPSPQEIVSNNRGGYLTEEDDISEIIAQHGDFPIVVKDVNGQRAIFNASDFVKLYENKAFTDRIRETWIAMKPIPKGIEYGTPEMTEILKNRQVGNVLSKPEMDKEFMSELQIGNMLENSDKLSKTLPQIGKLVDVSGISLTNNSTVTRQGAERFKQALTDNNIRQSLKDNNIKGINIEPPHRFGLSEQANTNVKKGIINISADATNPTQTILHELGHNKFESLSKKEQNALIEFAKDTKDPEMQGYKSIGAWKEIIADSFYNKPEFYKEFQNSQKKLPQSIFPSRAVPVTASTKVQTPLPEEGSPMDYATDIYETSKINLPPEIEIQPPEKVMVGDEKTPLSQKVRFIDYLRTPWRVFERMKIRPQYEELLRGYENYVSELPKNIDKITAWSKQVSKEGNEKIFRSLDGENIALTPDEARVAGEVKTWLSEWADRLGMKADERISEYITHIFPFGKGGEIPEEIAFLINKKIPGSVYDPFLLQREGAEGYIKDTWKALDAYTKRATRKVNMDPALASLKEVTTKMTDTSQLNYLNRYIGAINLRPTELDTLIDNHIKDKVGYLFGARPTASITRMIRQMIARAKIGGSVTSFAKNLTQGVNTFSDLGTVYTMKGYMDLVRFGGKELKENGVLIAPFVEDRTYSAVKKMAEKFDNVLFINMTASELVNRGAAYYGAKAKFINGKITPKEYKQAFGEERPANYIPTMEDAVHYGKFVSGKTQFLFGPLDTPVGLNSDIAKTFAQFQTFGLKQTEFIMSMIGQKNWWKLIRYLASSMLLFSFIGSAFGMKWDDSFKTFKFGIPPALQFGLDIWGAITGAKDQYGNVPSGSSRVRTVGNSIFTNVVPAGAQIKRSVEGFQSVDQGASRSYPSVKNPQGAFQYKIDKTPMNYIRGTLFGKGNLDQAKEYYNRKNKKAPSGQANRFKGL